MRARSALAWFTTLIVLVDGASAEATKRGATSPTLYIAGDSTAAKDDGSPELLGWGEKIGQYLSITVANDAVAGATTRTYTEQGYFAEIINAVQPRDLVIIEFGHNDNRSLADNPTTGDCPGSDLTTICNINGTIVYTFKKYMQDAITSLKLKRAQVIISSQTPDNPYNITTNPVFVPYAAQLARSNRLSYIDHFHLLLREYTDLGENATNALFPLDQHVHTSPEGADFAAQAVIRGALCESWNPLFPFITNTSVVPGRPSLTDNGRKKLMLKPPLSDMLLEIPGQRSVQPGTYEN